MLQNGQMRYLEPFVTKDLAKKMVFLGGPRQCGKTTLAKSLLEKSKSGRYFNWDLDEDRSALLKKAWSDHDRLLVFDEIHKFKRWKNWVKGVFDTQRPVHEILVTGSARLDVYRRGGDSLLGRYHYWRLHPFTLSELPAGISRREGLDRLMSVGGFPEPFLDNDVREAKRWRRERLDRVLRDDIRELENLKDISTLDLLVQLLRTRVGGPIVVSNLAEDLHVSPKTILSWIEALERMYVLFRVKPFSRNLPRALHKSFKVYFFDNGDVIGDEGARFENLVATHLLKHLQFREDRGGERLELCYIRDKEKHEVDFAVIDSSEAAPRVIELVEAKWADGQIAPSLAYFAERLGVERATQIVGHVSRPRDLVSRGKLRAVSALDELSCGPW